MRRIGTIACFVALAAGLVAAFAYAASVRDFGGAINQGGRIRFSAVRNNGKYTRAGLFAFRKLPVRCNGGRTAKVFFRTDNAVDVHHRKFRYRFHFGGDGAAKVHGRFVGHGGRARGIINVLSLDPNGPRGDRKNCTTGGARGWKASRG
jgi:hypothetical protein